MTPQSLALLAQLTRRPEGMFYLGGEPDLPNAEIFAVAD